MILGKKQIHALLEALNVFVSLYLFWQEVVLSAEHDEFYQKVSFEL